LLTPLAVADPEAIPDGVPDVQQTGLVLVLREVFVDHVGTTSLASAFNRLAFSFAVM
jgi:hypothetical protein